MKQALVDYSEKMKNPDLLEAEFVIRANDEFHKISDQVAEKTGTLDSGKIYFMWDQWLKRALKKASI